MQQTPFDAFTIADLLWRVRPRLLIELGTSGGGGALFYARVMRGYDPEARVLTYDPALAGTLNSRPLRNWNQPLMNKFCPHCVLPSDTSLWEDAVTFIRGTPTDPEPLSFGQELVANISGQGYPVLITEDSNHMEDTVIQNIRAFAPLVTPGSFMIVQDTRGGLFSGPSNAITTFLREQHAQPLYDHKGTRVLFRRDRGPEYFFFSQHCGGYLRRLEEREMSPTT